MQIRSAILVGAGVLVLTTACGTGGVTLSDAASPSDPSAETISVSSTTIRNTTSTTTTTTTTTTIPQVPMQFDEEGVPLNGQTHGAVVTPTGHVIPAFGRSGTGWRVWSPCGEEVVIDAGQYIESVDVVIDPGHGGPDEPGAVGPNGLRESDLNLAVAERVATGLRAAGYSVVMTRIHDDRIPIVTRAEIALALDPLAFVSIHHNAGVSEPSDSPGTEMYHQIDDPESKRLAGLMLEEARAVLAEYDAAWVSMSDAGAMARPDSDGDDYYGVLRRPAGVASVLAELAYLSNEPEAEMLERPDVQEALAGSIVRAVERFTTSDDPGSGFVDDPIFRGYGPSGAGHTEGCIDPVLQ